MPFGVGQRNHVLDGVQIPLAGRNFGGKWGGTVWRGERGIGHAKTS